MKRILMVVVVGMLGAFLTVACDGDKKPADAPSGGSSAPADSGSAAAPAASAS